MLEDDWHIQPESAPDQNAAFSYKQGTVLLLTVIFIVFGLQQYLSNQVDLHQHQLTDLANMMYQQKNVAGEETGSVDQELDTILSRERANLTVLRQISVDIANSRFCVDSMTKKNQLWQLTIMAGSYLQSLQKMQQWQTQFPAFQIFVNRIHKNKQGRLNFEIKIKGQNAGFAQFIKRKSKTVL